MRNSFNLNSVVTNQNNRVWVGVKPACLLTECDKFALLVTVSTDACFGDKERLYFVDESAKVGSVYYIGRLLHSLVDDC